MEHLLERTAEFNPTSRIRKAPAIRFKKAETESELNAVYRLRYRVYCEEKGFEKPVDHPGGVETDEYDENSIHFMAASGELVVGTARLIVGSEKEFPIERYCRITAPLSGLDRTGLAEISRLAVSKEYSGGDMASSMRRRMIVFALYKLIYAESKKSGFTHWLAVMSEGLHQLLKKTGIVFTPIGPAVDYHGMRTPYIGSIEEIEAGVSKVNPELFKEASEELKRHFRFPLAV